MADGTESKATKATDSTETISGDNEDKNLLFLEMKGQRYRLGKEGFEQMKAGSKIPSSGQRMYIITVAKGKEESAVKSLVKYLWHKAELVAQFQIEAEKKHPHASRYARHAIKVFGGFSWSLLYQGPKVYKAVSSFAKMSKQEKLDQAGGWILDTSTICGISAAAKLLISGSLPPLVHFTQVGFDEFLRFGDKKDDQGMIDKKDDGGEVDKNGEGVEEKKDDGGEVDKNGEGAEEKKDDGGEVDRISGEGAEEKKDDGREVDRISGEDGKNGGEGEAKDFWFLTLTREEELELLKLYTQEDIARFVEDRGIYVECLGEPEQHKSDLGDWELI